MEFEYYQTPRLSLRKITPAVLDYVFQEMTPKEQIAFLGLRNGEALQIEMDKYAEGLTTYNRKFEYFQMLDLETDKIIGWAGFHTWYIEHRRAELGYGLYNENDKRKGFMTEAIDFILLHGFKTLNLNRIEALTARSNSASMAVLKKFGFTREGVLRKHYNENGTIGDSVMYSLLQSEWKPRRK